MVDERWERKEKVKTYHLTTYQLISHNLPSHIIETKEIVIRRKEKFTNIKVRENENEMVYCKMGRMRWDLSWYFIISSPISSHLPSHNLPSTISYLIRSQYTSELQSRSELEMILRFERNEMIVDGEKRDRI